MTDTDAIQPTPDPHEHVAAYCAAFATGSSAVVDRFYEPDSVLIPSPGALVTGAPDRQTALAHLLGYGLPMTAQARQLYVAGDVALAIVDWSIRGTARQGFPLDLRGSATDVLRRGADGRWRYLIDNPFGTGAG
ncbi:YybH family protein [Actinoplanes utahensis]|uniref:Hydrolase n=1 Tax=Actinoplanes utahensis TaxID=1869 RepID=A0A0A6UT10_ACTUT|nr:DUF4440 domain-containing protein [Actinoplanes utahensis]KHD78133.1 hydrolase [Actinoplanes utahensis]GIF30619.1 hypothetical protein Aut01nite_36050 [Actinoplanes utahensis]